MICTHCQDLLSPYLDGISSPDERDLVIAHLVQCTDCAKRLSQLEQNRQLIRVLPVAKVTREMETRLLSRVRSLESRVQNRASKTRNTQHAIAQAWWRKWPMLSFGTVATCAASLLFYFAMMQAPPKVSAEEVVSTMDQLIGTLDPNEGERAITEETADEAAPVWQEDFHRGFVNEDNDQN
jgi:anti-sigma factor RsiW